MNTKMEYLYRDASNHKRVSVCILEGEITKEQIREIISCLSGGEHFIPYDVGLPEIRFREVTEDDHIWFELNENSFSLTLEKDAEMSVDKLVESFLGCKNNWNEAAAITRLYEEE